MITKELKKEINISKEEQEVCEKVIQESFNRFIKERNDILKKLEYKK